MKRISFNNYILNYTMKSNSTFNIALFLIGIILISLNFNSSNQEISIYPETPQRTTLVKYGEEVFRKENCIECHTFNISNESAERYSLDGFGGTRSSEFVAGLLITPRDFFPGSKMPSYVRLSYSELNETTLKETFRKNQSVSASKLESEWSKLNTQAESLMEEINLRSSAEHPKSEAIALIAFLQFIPSSQVKKKRDSIKNNMSQILALEQDELYKNSESVIRKAANDVSNISRGKELFQKHCAVCHGENGQGEIGPNLIDEYWFYGGKINDIAEVIINGAPKGMPNYKYVFTPTKVGEIIAYINSEKGKDFPYPKDPQGEKE